MKLRIRVLTLSTLTTVRAVSVESAGGAAETAERLDPNFFPQNTSVEMNRRHFYRGITCL